MSQLKLDRATADDLRRLIRDQLADALELLEHREPGDPTAIHEGRRTCKKLRALIRLIRLADPLIAQELNTRLRNAAHSVSPVRDRDARKETIAWLRQESPQAEDPFLAEELNRFDDDSDQTPPVDEERLADTFGRQLDETRQRAESYNLPDLSESVLRKGLGIAYRRARRAFQQLSDEPTPEQVHLLRRRTKTLYYQLRILRGYLAAKSAKAEKRSRKLGVQLGLARDLLLLRLAGLELGPPDSLPVPPMSLTLACATNELDRVEAARQIGKKLFRRPTRKFLKAIWRDRR